MPTTPSSPAVSFEAADEVVVRLDEPLLADGLADARWLLHDALLGGARWIVVDLSRVYSLNSQALASFLSAHRVCRARGGAVVLRGADRRTLDMVHRTGLGKVLRLQGGSHRRGEEVSGAAAATATPGAAGVHPPRSGWVKALAPWPPTPRASLVTGC